MSSNPCEDCYAHSGIEAQVDSCQKGVDRVEENVDELKKFVLWILATAVLSLFGIVVGFVSLWMKAPTP